MQNLRTVYAVLVCSLMLNAFFIGFICARAAGPHMHPPMTDGAMRGPRPHDFMREGLSAIGGDERAKVAAILDADKSDKDARFREMHARFAEMRGVLTAPKLDLGKFAAIEKEITAQDQKLKQGMSALVRKVATALPDDDRIKFFSAAMQDLPGPHDKDDDEDRGDRRPDGADAPPPPPEN